MNLLELKKKIGRSKSYLILKKIIIKSFYYLPINGKKIVFDNFGGRGYGDDPKYIAEEIRKKYNNDFKLIESFPIKNNKRIRFNKKYTNKNVLKVKLKNRIKYRKVFIN